jgi:tRNA A-37 threonylcarbamoyl transferase component Bud32
VSTEKRLLSPNTDEVFRELAEAQHGVEHLAGTVLLDRYRLVELRGNGGAAVVYQAEHSLMQKPMAVKILRPELAVRPDFVQRFLAEARTVARLRHENIVDIVDVGRTENGLVFCVMELLEGEELAKTMEREGPIPWRRARDIVMQVCNALAAAHAAGVVHRDVKPQNCFRIRRGGNSDFVKLLDFGIAKRTDTDQGLTATGVIMGTAEYMSPEQARGSDVDARADIYSVGAMLFEMLAGRPPFEGATFIDVLVKQASEPAPRISSFVGGLDPAIDSLIARTLAKRAEDRFASIEHLIRALAIDDGHTFHGQLDTAILTARPESVLPGASPAGVIDGKSRGLDYRVLVALLLFGGVVVLLIFAAQHWMTDDSRTIVAVAPGESTTSLEAVAVPDERPAPIEDSSEPAAQLPEEPRGPKTDARAPVDAATSEPPIGPDIAAPSVVAPTSPSASRVKTRDNGKSKARGGRVEDACVLEPDLPRCRSGSKPSTPKLPPTPPDPAISDKLSAAEVSEGVKPDMDEAKACLWKHPGDHVLVKLKIIGATGKVKWATAQHPHSGTSLGNCVEAALRKSTFRKFGQASQTPTIKVGR